MGSYRDLEVFKKTFALAMDIYEVSKSFPKEERYSLTDQVRRSSRSVCANFGEACRRRKYPAHFASKLADCDAENTGTEIWINFCFSCKYIDEKCMERCATIGRMLGYMMNHPENTPTDKRVSILQWHQPTANCPPLTSSIIVNKEKLLHCQ